MSYKVKLDIFEGPFDLLVYLIEHARMSIYDIRVSEITTQYLDYVSKLKETDVELAEEFMVLAAELIELKSRMLLPRSIEPGDDGEYEDPRSQLVAKILEYKQYKEMAAFLAEQQEAVSHIHVKPSEDLSVYTDNPDELLRTDTESFADAFKAFLFRKQRVEEMHRVYDRIERRRMSMESKIGEFKKMFKSRKTLMFSEMLEKDDSAFNKVVSFVTLLQLLKEHSVSAEQKKRFGDIKIKLLQDADSLEAAAAEQESG